MEAATKQTMELQGATPVDSTHCATNKITTRQGKRPCYRCGGRHSLNDCQFKEQQCNTCKKQRHVAKMCLSGTNSTNNTKKVQYVADTTPIVSPDGDNICLLNKHSVSSDNKIIIHPTLNGKQVPMEGANKSAMSEHTWRSLRQPKLNIKTSLVHKQVHLKAYRLP